MDVVDMDWDVGVVPALFHSHTVVLGVGCRRAQLSCGGTSGESWAAGAIKYYHI